MVAVDAGREGGDGGWVGGDTFLTFWLCRQAVIEIRERGGV